MSVQTEKQPISMKNLIIMIMTFALPLAILLIPTNELFTPQIRLYLSITLFAILTFIFGNLNQTAIAILLPIAYVVIAQAPAAAVFAPWSTYIPWFAIGGLFLANVMDRTNLLKRIAYNSILLTGASYNGIIWGLALAGIVLYLMIPGNTVFPLAALAYGLCKALNLDVGKETAGITMAAAIAALLPAWFIFNAYYGLLTGLGQGVAGPVNLTWIQYFMNNSVSFLFYAFMFWIITKMFKPSVPVNAKEYFKVELQKLGKMSLDEKKIIIMSVFLFIFLLTTQYHKIEAGWGFIIFPMLLYFPGLSVATNEDLKNVNYGMAIFTASCMGIGTTAGVLGIGKVVAAVIMPLLAGKGIMFIFGTIYAMVFSLNFLMTPLAIMSAFTLPLTQIAMSFGINPAAWYMFMQISFDSIILPYQYVLYLIFFSFGIVKLSDFVKFQAAKTVLTMIFVFVILIPFWRLIGFLMM
ncbi:SLC13 family permease [Desulfosporosinus nitroreducens]|uniref:Anion permease n=1 Tax=Desulfosporosinus nitroreducens TaxID=2018668 RepID=A0ABT8QYJ4_9FIRM|nr:anion permease [Desulfosporosinus nitroreducens]MCO1602064.1 anion permease [Desulfosporosinus nitroreducens]MDO0825705.1 anion permease [Desulfosporosinus nitroreducens]